MWNFRLAVQIVIKKYLYNVCTVPCKLAAADVSHIDLAGLKFSCIEVGLKVMNATKFLNRDCFFPALWSVTARLAW